ncbi:MAG: hypothetical protein KA105_06735 [Caulobacter sp.]|nr:hypothetical protein [Caulobacter sp.]
MDPRLRALAARLVKAEARELEIGVSLLWFLTHTDQKAEFTASDIAQHMKDLQIKSGVNASRLKANLAAHPDVVRGSAPNSFKIRAGRDSQYVDRYGDLRSPESIPVRDDVLPPTLSLGGRRHFNALKREINGAYEYGFYNSCAVMCRRLMECLLIDAFEYTGNLSVIALPDKSFRPLSEIINLAKTGVHIRLSRSVLKVLDKVKDTGDPAAHSRRYLTSKQDIDDLNPGLRQLLAELSALAGM